MKIKIALITFCFVSISQTCAMQDTPKKRTYDQVATQGLEEIMRFGIAHRKSELLTLLDNGANPDTSAGAKSQQTFLHLTVGFDFDLVKSALLNGGNPNAVDYCGYSSLHQAYDAYSYDVDRGQKVIAALLLAGANSEIKNREGHTALAELRRCNPEHVPAVQEIASAAPIVKAEREAYNPRVAQLLKVHLPQPITAITMDFVGPLPIWDDGCWDLFQKHMEQAKKSDQVKRLK